MARRVLRQGLGALVALALVAPLAVATELSPEEYLARAEPICQVNTEANARIFQGMRAMVKAGKLGQAAARFDRAAGALAKTIAQLKAVPRPAEERARLTKWLGYLEVERSYLANDAIVGLGFVYCDIEPSRFS